MAITSLPQRIRALRPSHYQVSVLFQRIKGPTLRPTYAEQLHQRRPICEGDVAVLGPQHPEWLLSPDESLSSLRPTLPENWNAGQGVMDYVAVLGKGCVRRPLINKPHACNRQCGHPTTGQTYKKPESFPWSAQSTHFQSPHHSLPLYSNSIFKQQSPCLPHRLPSRCKALFPPHTILCTIPPRLGSATSCGVSHK